MSDKKTDQATDKPSSVKGLKEQQSHFLATISHEIRTPLNAISGMSQLLSDSGLSDTQLQFVDTIQRAGTHLLSLIDNMLDVAKFEAGDLVLTPEPFSVEDELRRAAAEVKSLVDEKGLSFSIFTTPDLAGLKVLDRRRFRQCLANLLGNAAKFTEKGGIELSAKISPNGVGNGGNLMISVRDSGPGIAPENQDKVFKLFQQVDTGIKREFDGPGLGLPVTRLLARKMGGDLTMSSRPGKGSTFFLTLSYTDANETRLQDGQENAHVLVVEDNRTNQRLLSLVLDKLGHSCAMAENGQVGFEMFRSQKFDLVLMDLHMPVMDGFECTAAIRKSGHKNADLPIVALTADVRPGIEERVAQAGMDAYLAKPFELPELASMIRTALMARKDAEKVSPDARTQTG